MSDGINDHIKRLREVIQAFKVRVAFIGHPHEKKPIDWSREIAFADEVLQETVCVQRMVLTQDDDCHWYLIPESEAKEFYKVLNNIGRWIEFKERWGDKRLAMHPGNYSFTDLQERKQ